MLRKKIIYICLLLIPTIIFSGSLAAEQRLILGAKLLGSGWQGSNADASTFSSDSGGQFAGNIAWQSNKFYAGLNLQNGNYEFTDTAPDQLTFSGSVPAGTEQIQQSEMDLLVGYYFWSQVSVFMDIKSVSNQWQSNQYEQSFGGLGLGVSGFNSLNNDWTLFASLGFVSGDLKNKNGKKIGNGNSSALEVGLVYVLSDVDSLNLGIKLRSYEFKSNAGIQQNYDINALFVGYTYAFNID